MLSCLFYAKCQILQTARRRSELCVCGREVRHGAAGMRLSLSREDAARRTGGGESINDTAHDQAGLSVEGNLPGCEPGHVEDGWYVSKHLS
jgi:hypothetical protein